VLVLELLLILVGVVFQAFVMLVVTGSVVVTVVAVLCIAFGAVLQVCYKILDWLEGRGWR